MQVQVVDGKVMCGWFGTACGLPADGAVEHPILEYVPCCSHHAELLGLDLVSAEWDLSEVSP